MSEIIDISTENLVDADHIFNSSICYVGEDLYMAYRTNNALYDAKIYITKLDRKSYQPIGESMLLDIPNTTTTPVAAWEDPRLFWFNNRLYCSFVFLRIGHTAQAQGLARLDKNFKVVNVWFLKYKYNHNQATMDVRRVMSPKGFIYTYNPGNIFEKNWQFFQHGKELMFIYQAKPHTVAVADLIKGDVKNEYVVNKELPWKWGEIRGGTPPIEIDKNRYITFFHSAVQKKPHVKVYYSGAYTFQNKPPFTPLEITTKPLLVGDESDKNRGLWNNVVVFPCGSVIDNDSWLISYGHNDYCTKLLKITKQEVENTLIKI